MRAASFAASGTSAEVWKLGPTTPDVDQPDHAADAQRDLRDVHRAAVDREAEHDRRSLVARRERPSIARP